MCGIMLEGQAQGFLEIFAANKPVTDGEMVVLERASKVASRIWQASATSGKTPTSCETAGSSACTMTTSYLARATRSP